MSNHVLTRASAVPLKDGGRVPENELRDPEHTYTRADGAMAIANLLN